MRFEYDANKSDSNKRKHGLDFEEAQAMWAGPVLTVRLNYPDEPRYAAIGLLDGKHWTAIITYRGDATRIISFRRSHPKEERAYDQAILEC